MNTPNNPNTEPMRPIPQTLKPNNNGSAAIVAPTPMSDTLRPVNVVVPDQTEQDTHPIGTAVGAAAGGVAGAAVGVAAAAATGLAAGMVAGPIGAAVGLVAGALIGGVAGSEAAEAVNPTVEENHWSGAFTAQPYYLSSYTYDDYRPAYRVGYEGYSRYKGKSFDEVEDELRDEYIRNRGNSRLGWMDARPATRSAWDRVGSSQSAQAV